MPESARSASLRPIPRGFIEGNRWDLLVPDGDASWTPHRSVSICIPARNPGHRLERLLRALTVQTYPTHLLEVIVADDSSAIPITVDAMELPFNVSVIRQDVDRFAAGRARQLAAGAASGEVLVFFDADMVPSRQVLDAYLRWFELSDAVVPFGFTTFVDWPTIDAATIMTALREDDDDILDGAGQIDSQSWRERTFNATNDLRRETADMFRTLVGATLAVSAAQYREVGGFRDLGVRGVEDIEFGYRLQNNGAILIPDRAARHWHPGGRTMSGERVEEIRRKREPFTSALLPVGGFRPANYSGQSPVDVVPKLLVHVPEAFTERTPADYADEVERAGGPDVAARVGHIDVSFQTAFAQAAVITEAVWNDWTASAIVDEMLRRKVGTLLVVSDTAALVAEVVMTRAIRSVRQVDAEGRRDIRRLFGVAVIDAAAVGLEPLRGVGDDALNSDRESVGNDRGVMLSGRRTVRSIADAVRIARDALVARSTGLRRSR